MKNKITITEGMYGAFNALEVISGAIVLASMINKVSKHKICNFIVAFTVVNGAKARLEQGTIGQHGAFNCYEKMVQTGLDMFGQLETKN